MNNLNHPHPGALIRDQVLDPLALSVNEAATKLCMTPASLMAILEGHAPITLELATNLERIGVSTARFWIALQAEYELR